MNKKWLWNNLTGHLLALDGPLEVAIHLLNEKMASAFFEFVKHYNPRSQRRYLFKKIKKPLEQISIVLSQISRRWRSGRIFGHNAGKNLTPETQTNLKHFIDVGNFGL